MINRILMIAVMTISFDNTAKASIFSSIKNKISSSSSSSHSGSSNGSTKTSSNPIDWNELKNAITKGDTTLICRESGICRKFGGIGCSISKDWFSTCAVICDGFDGFMNSTCTKNAKSHFRFNTQNLSYGDGEHVADHLQRQLEKGPKGQSNALQSGFFSTFCKAGGSRFIHDPNIKNSISNGCDAFNAGGIEALNEKNQQIQAQKIANSVSNDQPEMQDENNQPQQMTQNKGNRNNDQNMNQRGRQPQQMTQNKGNRNNDQNMNQRGRQPQQMAQNKGNRNNDQNRPQNVRSTQQTYGNYDQNSFAEQPHKGKKPAISVQSYNGYNQNQNYNSYNDQTFDDQGYGEDQFYNDQSYDGQEYDVQGHDEDQFYNVQSYNGQEYDDQSYGEDQFYNDQSYDDPQNYDDQNAQNHYDYGY